MQWERVFEVSVTAIRAQVRTAGGIVSVHVCRLAVVLPYIVVRITYCQESNSLAETYFHTSQSYFPTSSLNAGADSPVLGSAHLTGAELRAESHARPSLQSCT